MSYTYLQAEGAESSADSFSAIVHAAPWKSNHTAESNSSNGNETESCRGSQSGMMSQPSTASRGKESLTSSAVASLAKTSPAPEPPMATKESKENGADYGVRWPASYAKWDAATSSWKTHQCSLLGGWEPFSETWPRWGMMHDGESYPLPPLAPPISESEFGYLPTPDASLGMFDGAASMDLVTCFNKELTGVRKSGVKIGSSLRWHPEFIHEWQRTGGELNAEWIEALMGWPVGWTDCTPLETDKFQAWWQLHGGSCPRIPQAL